MKHGDGDEEEESRAATDHEPVNHYAAGGHGQKGSLSQKRQPGKRACSSQNMPDASWSFPALASHSTTAVFRPPDGADKVKGHTGTPPRRAPPLEVLHGH
jgi:hypothetical protein